MKFSARSDVRVPAEQVFAKFCDYQRHERAAMRRGVNLTRARTTNAFEPGLGWDAAVSFRGKIRKFNVELTDVQHNERIDYKIMGRSLKGAGSVEILALTPNKSRVAYTIEVRPKNFAARLLIQSLRVIKPKLNRKFKRRAQEFTENLVKA